MHRPGLFPRIKLSIQFRRQSEIMNKQLRDNLISYAKDTINSHDPSHDLNHALRVLSLAENISRKEKTDMDVVVPAALFHDVVCYPKDDLKSACSAGESAELAKTILSGIDDYPKEKIDKVADAIKKCSFSKGIIPESLEGKILQDADGLEATGAISIMRTFASTGSMKRPFYNAEDPFCKKRQPDALKYALDLFYTRLLVVEKRMHTKTAGAIAKRRTQFLRKFLSEFKSELQGK